MEIYNIVVLLLVFSGSICGAEKEVIQQHEQGEVVVSEIANYIGHIWRRPLCSIWDRIQDVQESRRETRPETLKFYTMPVKGTIASTPINHDFLCFNIDWPLGEFATRIMLACSKHDVAHERIHYAEADGQTIDHDHAIFKEFRADVKGLLLWDYHKETLSQILHGLYHTHLDTQADQKPYFEKHPKAYETLLCWNLLKQKQKQSFDIDADAFIKDFISKRHAYQYTATHVRPFLGALLQKQSNSLQGRVSMFMTAPLFSQVLTESLLFTSAGLLALVAHTAFRSEMSIVISFISCYLFIRNVCGVRLNFEYVLGLLLCRVFNSPLLWNNGEFRRALDMDTLVIEEIVKNRDRDSLWKRCSNVSF